MSFSAASPSEPPPDVPAKHPTSVRWSILALLALAAVTAYLTRICLSGANTTIAREFQISDSRMGEIISAFFLGYLWFQVPTGWLGRRWGARVTLASLGVAAAGCTAWGAFSRTPESLLYSRIALGIVQAGLVPCASRAVVDWFPTRSRGIASAIVASSMSLGAVLATWLTTQLLPVIPWRGVFLLYAALVLAWAGGFYYWFRDHPEQHPAANSAEAALIRDGTGPAPHARAEGSVEERLRATFKLLGAMAASSSAWLICGQAYFRAFGQAFFLTWFPAFLEKGHGVPRTQTGTLAMLPLAANVVGGLIGGYVVDYILKRTGSRRLSRSGTATATTLGCVLCTLGATYATTPFYMVLLLSAGAFFFGLANPTGWAAAMDISGEHTQVVFAIQNMCGNIGAMQCSKVVGDLFAFIQHARGTTSASLHFSTWIGPELQRIPAQHVSWNLVLYLFVGIHAAGGLCWALLNPNRSAVQSSPDRKLSEKSA